MKKALITGITGQDGSYLADLLIAQGYMVYGMRRYTSTNNLERVKHLLDNPNFSLNYGDLTDSASIYSLVDKIRPDEIYNLGAQSHVGNSFKVPEATFDINAGGVLRILEAIRQIDPKIRFYQASTSELFGKVRETPQTENTPFYPRSPYGIAKLAAYWYVVNYRESYNIFACNGILFNHESPRRGEEFVTKKIVHQMVEIAERKRECMWVGNMESKRDWGYAGEYVEAMHSMLQMDKADDFVIATGETHTIRELVELVAKKLDISITWDTGSLGMFNVGINSKTGEVIIRTDPELYRPTEVDVLLGDASKAKSVLGWEPKTKFNQLVDLMVDAEFKHE